MHTILFDVGFYRYWNGQPQLVVAREVNIPADNVAAGSVPAELYFARALQAAGRAEDFSEIRITRVRG